VFYNDYKDLQTHAYEPSLGVNLRTNVGQAHTYGLELETISALSNNLQLTFNLGYLQSQYDDFENASGPGVDANGKQLVVSPRWNASAGLIYTIPIDLPGALLVGTDAQFQTKSYANALNDDIQEIPKQTFWNAPTSYITGDGHWTTTPAVKNLLDRAYPQPVGYVPSSGARYYSINDPRTVLLSVRYDL